MQVGVCVVYVDMCACVSVEGACVYVVYVGGCGYKCILTFTYVSVCARVCVCGWVCVRGCGVWSMWVGACVCVCL